MKRILNPVLIASFFQSFDYSSCGWPIQFKLLALRGNLFRWPGNRKNVSGANDRCEQFTDSRNHRVCRADDGSSTGGGAWR